jgi:hypothetical protein
MFAFLAALALAFSLAAPGDPPPPGGGRAPGDPPPPGSSALSQSVAEGPIDIPGGP